MDTPAGPPPAGTKASFPNPTHTDLIDLPLALLRHSANAQSYLNQPQR